MPATGIVRINDTLQYIPKASSFLKTYTEYYLQQEIGYIISIMQDPPKTLTFLSYMDETKNATNHIAHILQQSTAQHCLQILPLPPMLPHSHTQYPSPPIINHPPALDPRVEPVVQPPRVKTLMTEPTPPLRVNDSPYPSSDPF